MRHTKAIPQALEAIASAQGGAFTRPQVLDSGGTQAMIRRLLRSGQWIRVAQGIYTASPTVTFEALCHAGLLLAAPDAVVGGLAAGHLHGVCPPPSRLTIWGHDSRASGPWRFRRGRREGVGSPPRLRIDDAVLDSCAESREADVLELLATALRSQLTTPARLRERAVELTTLKRRSMILDLLPSLEDGVQSTLESHFVHQVQRAHRLPEGTRQVSVSPGTRSDVILDEYQLVIELDGRRGHEGLEKWRDYERDNEHLRRGMSTLRFGWHDVVLRSCQVAAMIAEILVQRGWLGVGGRVRRCGPRCAAT